MPREKYEGNIDNLLRLKGQDAPDLKFPVKLVMLDDKPLIKRGEIVTAVTYRVDSPGDIEYALLKIKGIVVEEFYTSRFALLPVGYYSSNEQRPIQSLDYDLAESLLGG